ncbi:hypothetical protein TSUD_330300 [Trifolium subterraneum]|nr:hypothetical protein TSUD_330300 [Trifolium subterraneum]
MSMLGVCSVWVVSELIPNSRYPKCQDLFAQHNIVRKYGIVQGFNFLLDKLHLVPNGVFAGSVGGSVMSMVQISYSALKLGTVG